VRTVPAAFYPRDSPQLRHGLRAALTISPPPSIDQHCVGVLVAGRQAPMSPGEPARVGRRPASRQNAVPSYAGSGWPFVRRQRWFCRPSQMTPSTEPGAVPALRRSSGQVLAVPVVASLPVLLRA
jgi:hypothetical protein